MSSHNTLHRNNTLMTSSHYASTDIFSSPKKRPPTTLPKLAEREESPLCSKQRFAIYDQLYSTTLPEISRNQLQFLEKIGQGEFGEVHLCRLENRRVAVKMLNKRINVTTSNPSPSGSPDSGIDDEAELSFEREMRVLGSLKHANVVEVIGVCTSGRPLCCVMEYMENGDVKRYMHTHPDIDAVTALSMCTQMAAGMSYLESQGFVHRDLAARNCLLDAEFTVKIGDFGMARSLYSEEYYRIEGESRLPVRWMSWECMLMGKFSTSSDVWAFGVTMWEVLSRCHSIPYPDLSHEEVVANIHSMHHTGRLETYLACPELCPPQVYRELMISCWARDATARPTFQSIHHYLLTLQHITLSRT